MRQQSLKSLHHVRVAQVPALHPPAEHSAVILFGILDHTSILLGKEELIRIQTTVAVKPFACGESPNSASGTASPENA
jgi:hypothetical protein